jgi:hypothetical protein
VSLGLWLIALAVGGVMIACGIALHPALTIGGSLIAAIALAKSLQLVWDGRA